MNQISQTVRKLRKERKLTQRELGERVGVTQQAIQELEAGKIDKPRFIVDLARVLGVQPSQLSDISSVTSNHSLTLTELTPLSVKVRGTIQAGSWRDIDGAEDIDVDMIVPASPGYSVEFQKAYIVSGESLNKVASDGDIIVCLDLRASGVEIKDGDFVVVEKTRYDGQQIERTAKRYRKTLSGAELWPESNHPDHQKAISVDDCAEHETITIIGKVLWFMRRP